MANSEPIPTSYLQAHGINPETIQRYDTRVPRYTSYPTVPFWTEDFGPREFARHLEERSEAAPDEPLSLYVHLPFCRKRCLFCACNVIITRKDHVAGEYLDVLEREVALLRSHYRGRGKVIQLHLGGGTPNFLDEAQMGRLLRILENHFDFDPAAERSIEVDPRVATPEDIERFHGRDKFNRISYGVQDLDDEVQAAIGREQTRDITFANVEAARSAGFRSVNIDLIYGLPRQTPETWTDTLQRVLALRPDRIALYNFAFLPNRLAHQKSLEEEELATPEQKVEMFMAAHDLLTSNGWKFIGMDHYALEDDALARAMDDGTLRRNFMGYTTLKGTDLLAFGVSSISDFQGAFAQNVKKLTEHRQMVDEGLLPVEQGLLLSEDDILRRECIESVMCRGGLSFSDPGVAAIVREIRPELERLESEELIRLYDHRLEVTLRGRVFLRNIAVVFDAYMNRGEKPLFSRAV